MKNAVTHHLIALVSALLVFVLFASSGHAVLGLVGAAIVIAVAVAEHLGGAPFGTFGKPRRRYTWTPDHTDPRDKLYSPPLAVASRSDLTAGFPPPFDQGQLGSCTGNGWAAMLAFLHRKLLGDNTLFSRLFIYWGERWIEGTTRQDAGAMIRDGAKFLAKYGACAETLWPYVISKFKLKPAIMAWSAACAAKISVYMRVKGLDGVRACLSEGFPVVFGIRVYESFESAAVAKSGMVPMPAKGEQNLGGHCVVAVGHDDSKRLIKCRNSWGAGWGDGGYFYLPYDYITTPGYADDFWTVRK